MFECLVKLLGIIIDSKLTWERHIFMIRCRVARVIHLLRLLKQLILQGDVVATVHKFAASNVGPNCSFYCLFHEQLQK